MKVTEKQDVRLTPLDNRKQKRLVGREELFLLSFYDCATSDHRDCRDSRSFGAFFIHLKLRFYK